MLQDASCLSLFMCISKYVSLSSLLAVSLIYLDKHFLQYFCSHKSVFEYSSPQTLHLLSLILKGINKIGMGLDFNLGVGSKEFLLFVSILFYLFQKKNCDDIYRPFSKWYVWKTYRF